jgi:hypothetical protein
VKTRMRAPETSQMCFAPVTQRNRQQSTLPIPTALRASLEPHFEADFAHVRIHADTDAAERATLRSAAAFTEGTSIYFSAGRYAPETEAGRNLLAHELAHVVQQAQPGPKASNATAEKEADIASRQVMLGQRAPILHAATGPQNQDSPRDRAIVAQARRRLALLQEFEAQWQAREARRLRNARERDQQLEARTQMDRDAAASGSDLVEALNEGSREDEERRLLAQLNRLPLTIEVNETAVTFRVRFHVRFEDASMAGRYGTLVTTLQQGIDTIWNQPLSGEVFGGRSLQVIPETHPVASDADRDRRFWLISVRPSDDAPISYPGCELPQNDSGVPTSATDATCAGGLMSIPPSHISNSGVLGHELLHLMGLVDRYYNMVSVRPSGERINDNVPTRDTPDRVDPLGAEDGPVLREDLAFLFEHLGVYELEANRGLDVLNELEARGLSIGRVRVEMHRLEEIIRLGYDPRSLIQPRLNFNDALIRSAEDL